jgi:hypothetical protein
MVSINKIGIEMCSDFEMFPVSQEVIKPSARGYVPRCRNMNCDKPQFCGEVCADDFGLGYMTRFYQVMAELTEHTLFVHSFTTDTCDFEGCHENLESMSELFCEKHLNETVKTLDEMIHGIRRKKVKHNLEAVRPNIIKDIFGDA